MRGPKTGRVSRHHPIFVACFVPELDACSNCTHIPSRDPRTCQLLVVAVAVVVTRVQAGKLVESSSHSLTDRRRHVGSSVSPFLVVSPHGSYYRHRYYCYPCRYLRQLSRTKIFLITAEDDSEILTNSTHSCRTWNCGCRPSSAPATGPCRSPCAMSFAPTFTWRICG